MPRRLAVVVLMLWVLAAGALTAEAQIPLERGLLVGTWQLDSLRVEPIVSELSDSARASLDRYTRMLANANDQFASGRMRIVTEYTRDGRFIHSVFERSKAAAVHREAGRWERSATGAIACRHEPGTGHCPHHGATVIAVNERQLVLQLDLSGAARGLRETFWLTRSALQCPRNASQ